MLTGVGPERSVGCCEADKVDCWSAGLRKHAQAVECVNVCARVSNLACVCVYLGSSMGFSVNGLVARHACWSLTACLSMVAAVFAVLFCCQPPSLEL